MSRNCDLLEIRVFQTDKVCPSGYDGDVDDEDEIDSATKIDLEEIFPHLKIEKKSDNQCEYRDKLKHLIASYFNDYHIQRLPHGCYHTFNRKYMIKEEHRFIYFAYFPASEIGFSEEKPDIDYIQNWYDRQWQREKEQMSIEQKKFPLPPNLTGINTQFNGESISSSMPSVMAHYKNPFTWIRVDLTCRPAGEFTIECFFEPPSPREYYLVFCVY